ncbi:MAG: hypothetical protein CMH91_00785 [Oceanicaulis sp.]|uniref:esterase-like activity of phytase family protein n=1 Tax=unclassified Oceanicaulis TaxID=2632123 RepID=UPI000C3FA95E|nr:MULTISPECIES: esterase-like activity of phytase family protein [unclassified Oceanicaulis]MBC37582.1 hypothetical protein [Oceanicaulis sp.]HBU63755.1 hypothetical protein [Oceanicaulis sp.]HCR95256.1 hypothetical protein [Oceanicaulis sp.]|tara:strand:+ start:2874 stop:3893 length:1020 start_codon:yes stop_codon:yes gene_type:complete
MLVRLGLSVCLCPFLIACGGGGEAQTASESASLSLTPLPLFPDDPGRTRLGDLRYLGGVALDLDDERFGGWSALDISPDGGRLLAVSDSGYWMTASLQYDGDALVGLSEPHITVILDEAGEPVSDDFADSEGLADLGDGAYAVSFEREHRIWRYELGEDWSGVDDALPTPLANPLGTEALPNNAGMEGIAVIGDWLWSAQEHTTGNAPVHIFSRTHLFEPEQTGNSYLVAMEPEFGVTELESDGADGLYILQRFWSRDVGNRIHILHLTAEQIAEAPNVTELHPTLLAAIEPDEMSVDNFEGMAVIEREGQTRLFLISDDNYNDSQRTLLFSFVLEPRQ